MGEENHELLLPLVEEENICLPLPINVVSKYWNVELSMDEAIDAAKKRNSWKTGFCKCFVFLDRFQKPESWESWVLQVFRSPEHLCTSHYKGGVLPKL